MLFYLHKPVSSKIDESCTIHSSTYYMQVDKNTIVSLLYI